MKTIYTISFWLCFFSISNFAYSQKNQPKEKGDAVFQKNKQIDSKSLILDLAQIDPGQKITFPKNQTYDNIVIANTFIDSSYSISITLSNRTFASLEFPFGFVPTAQIEGDSSNSDCEKLKDAYDALHYIFDHSSNVNRSEKEIKYKILDIQAILDTTNSNKCDVLTDKILKLVSQCKKTFDQKIKVNDGEIMTIIVSCGNGARKWTWELVGDPIGEWVMSYGFGFCSTALAGKTYHLQQMDDTTIFKITQDEKPGTLELAYIPAIFYSFLPASKYNSRFNWSISAGLGFDLSAPVVFFGGGFMYRQNIGVNMGVAFQQQSKLYPQYSDGQILTSSMQDVQLHKQVYRPNLFISVNFRFDKSKDNEIKEAMKPK